MMKTKLIVILILSYFFGLTAFGATENKQYTEKEKAEAETYMKNYYKLSFSSIRAYKHYYTLTLFSNKFSKQKKLFNIADYYQIFSDNNSERLIYVEERELESGNKKRESEKEKEKEKKKSSVAQKRRSSFFKQTTRTEQKETKKAFKTKFSPDFIIYCITIKGNERCKLYTQDQGVGVRIQVVKSSHVLENIDFSKSLIISDLSNIYNISDFYLYGTFVKKIIDKKGRDIKVIQKTPFHNTYSEINYFFDSKKPKIKKILFKLSKYRFKLIKAKSFYKYKKSYFLKNVDIVFGARTFTAKARSNKFTVNQKIKNDVFEPFRFKSAIF